MDTTFSQSIEQSLRQLRGSVIDILSNLELSNERPQEVARRLGLDKSLAWKIARVAQTTDPFAVVQHLPGTAGIEIFFNSARDHGVDIAVLERAQNAIENLDSLCRTHAGDRATFNLMLSAFANEGKRDAQIAHRKQLFRGASSVLGIQTETEFVMYIISPNGMPDRRCDVAAIKGFTNITRLRPDVPWRIGRSRYANDDGTKHQPPDRRQAIDAALRDQQTAPLLTPFCSKPLPNIRRVDYGNGFVFDELVEGPVGNTGAVTCVTGELLRDFISNQCSDDSRKGYWTLSIETPVEWLLFDLIVHESQLAIMPPSLHIFSKLGGEPEYFEPGARGHRLPATESVIDLGQPPVVETAQVAGHGEMFKYICDQLEWNPNEFRGFRAAVQYPPLSSSVVLEHELFAR